MIQKISFSTLPLLVVTILVSVHIYDTSHNENNDALQAVEMNRQIATAELEMVKMSEALRGYLLNPDNKREFERKEAADESFRKAAKQLSSLVADDPETMALSKKMADFDESTLDAIENEVGKLIDAKSPNAIREFNAKYMPARTIQNGNFESLKRAIEAKSAAILKKIEAERKADGIRVILVLLGAVVFGLLGVLVIAVGNLKRALRVFKNVDEISSSVNQSAARVMTTSHQLSSSSTEQAAAITETATAIEQISVMIRKSSDQALQSARLSEESQNISKKGMESISELRGAMTEISSSQEGIITQVENGNREIANVTRLIQEIADKTKVINDIVFQTKLLSFNASVEAARAGESGKGFAVVAEEVGKLASMSGNAAQEIFDKLQGSTDQVEAIVKKNNERIDKMIKDGRIKIEEGSKASARCAEIFSDIQNKAREVHTRLEDVARAANEQTRGIQEINQAVHQLNQSTNQNTGLAHSAQNEAIGLKKHADSMNESISALRANFLGKTENQAGVIHVLPSKTALKDSQNHAS
jgi:methyl-accepting chemotaxis protein